MSRSRPVLSALTLLALTLSLLPGCGGIAFTQAVPAPYAHLRADTIVAVDPSITTPKVIPREDTAVADLYIWPIRLLILPKP